MDAAAAPPRVLESSPQKLEVGVRDQGLGWIEIRTHTVAGQVTATLASGTHDAHAAIVADLPAIRDSLASQHIALHGLSAERFAASSGGGGSTGHPSHSEDLAGNSLAKSRAARSPEQVETEADRLSYISVRI